MQAKLPRIAGPTPGKLIAYFSIYTRSVLATLCGIFASGLPVAYAGGPSTFEINNALSGQGRYSFDVRAAGDATSVAIFPIGQAGGFDVMSDFLNFVQVGGGGAATELRTTGNNTVAFVAQTGTVISNGNFAGSNGAITWNSEARIAAGSQRLELTLNFASAASFGAVRYISYFDADVDGASDDRLVLLDRASAPNLRLLVMDDNQRFGIAHGIPSAQLVNASYRGWVTRPYPLLVNNIRSPSGEVFSASGVIDLALISVIDTLFPYQTTYTNDNHTHAFAVDLNPTATQAKVVINIDAFPILQVDALLKTGFEN